MVDSKDFRQKVVNIGMNYGNDHNDFDIVTTNITFEFIKKQKLLWDVPFFMF